MAHPSGASTSQQIRQKFIWPNADRDIRRWARTCLPCQRSKIQRHNHLIPKRIPTPDSRFHQIHLDIIGPLPEVRGYRYCLTIIDRFSRWPKAIPLPNIHAQTVAAAFVEGWIARFGTPAVITTDQGRQFESSLFKALSNLLGATKTRTSPYHPESNGIIERWHRTFKTAITCTATTHTWLDVMWIVLLGLRTSYKPDLKCSSAEILYGAPLRVPGELLETTDHPADTETFILAQRRRLRDFRPQPTSHHIRRTPFVHRDLEDATHVFVRDDTVRKPFQHPYTGPHEVISRINERLYTIKINVRDVNTSTERLKPAYLPCEEEQPTTSEDAQSGFSQATTIAKVKKKVHFVPIQDPHSKGSRCGDRHATQWDESQI